ncbi:GNAT family N-acetyltransferase [Paenibacillus tritici]|nr:GNAT family protein [Paenibacillus tritici]QUL52297.1 GNAT family N-acetyltransferase [Paenibacillus tritici]
MLKQCPVIENEKFLVRLVSEADANDLLRVYSDKNALPFFNSDNCNGNIFYYQSEEEIVELIKFWIWEYECKRYVRFSIVDKICNEVIGTIELFKRISNDHFNGSGIMRLDVRSDFENKQALYEIMTIITNPAFELVQCSMIATKAVNYAVERIEALETMNYVKTKDRLLAADGESYSD